MIIKTRIFTQQRVKHLVVQVAERELEELRVVGQALNSEVNQLELFLAPVSIHSVCTLSQSRLDLDFVLYYIHVLHSHFEMRLRWSRWRKG